MKHAPAMNIEIDVPSDRTSYLSDTHATATVTTNAIAYGGTVNSCARSPLYPRPATIVGANSDTLEKPTENAMLTA